MSLKHSTLQTLDDEEAGKSLSSSKICVLTPIRKKKTTMRKLDVNLNIADNLPAQNSENHNIKHEKKKNLFTVHHTPRALGRMIRIKTEYQVRSF